MAFLEALFGVFCKSEDLRSCCDCKEEPEVLTKAWIDSLEQVSILSEQAVKLPGKAEAAPATPPESRAQSPPSATWSNLGQATATSAGLTMLWVPDEFDRVRGGALQRPIFKDVESSIYGVGGAGPKEQRQSLQVCLRAFTKALLRGITVSVLLDDGCTCLAEARMDSELTHLVLHVPNAQHPVALRSIESVSPPEEAWLPQAVGLRLGQLDLCCVTLIIEGGQFLTLVFDSSRTREYFEICLKVLILARESSCSRSRGGPDHERPAAVAQRAGDEGPAPKSDFSPETGSTVFSDPPAEQERPPEPDVAPTRV